MVDRVRRGWSSLGTVAPAVTAGLGSGSTGIIPGGSTADGGGAIGTHVTNDADAPLVTDEHDEPAMEAVNADNENVAPTRNQLWRDTIDMLSSCDDFANRTPRSRILPSIAQAMDVRDMTTIGNPKYCTDGPVTGTAA